MYRLLETRASECSSVSVQRRDGDGTPAREHTTVWLCAGLSERRPTYSPTFLFPIYVHIVLVDY
jgi:hypothetical protein